MGGRTILYSGTGNADGGLETREACEAISRAMEDA
jgi:hypothetical protein